MTDMRELVIVVEDLDSEGRSGAVAIHLSGSRGSGDRLGLVVITERVVLV
jgi:hypothetical protein